MKRVLSLVIWLAVVGLGVQAYLVLALRRNEPVSSIYLILAALCTYAIGYRFYSKWIAARVMALDNRRATPCQVHDDGKDFVKTNHWVVFGHHFAAISGPGPLVGPVLAAQFGYLPGTLWILIGVVLGGAVQDFVLLFASMRRDGKSLGQMVKEELNTTAGSIALVSILAIMVILLGVLGLVVVKALAESPWGVFTVGATIPIAMMMGGYMRFWRVGKVREASVLGAIGLLAAVWGGKLVYASPRWSAAFSLPEISLAWVIIVYGLAASILPVWLLLAPRDYLSTFMKLGTILALAVGILCVLPHLQMPALSRFANGSGPVVAGKIFPFCFITIACGAISGFHALIASGTTPKLITREAYARPIGYGAMCLESMVAIMAMIAACTLDPGVYLSMNIKGAAADTVAKVTALGFPVTLEHMETLAGQIGEHTLFGRTGGAATLAVGMAQIFSKVISGRWLDLWYHFAIMFEALFILTTVDAGTRVGRYILQDLMGSLWKPLADTRNVGANLLASGLMVCGWGYFLVQGVQDPLGGINSLWPLFGVANQMLAAIALCLATTIILKMQLQTAANRASAGSGNAGKPWLAVVTLLPLCWLVAVTFTAGVQKIVHKDPRIGFLAKADELQRGLKDLEEDVRRKLTPPLRHLEPATAPELKELTAPLETQLAALKAALAKAKTAKDQAAQSSAQSRLEAFAEANGPLLALAAAKKAVADNRTLRFNNLLDAGVAGVFLALVALILVISVFEWIALVARWRPASLRESQPVWLPDHALAEGQRFKLFGLFALALALARELTGEAEMERMKEAPPVCQTHSHPCDSRPNPGAQTGAQPAMSEKEAFVQTLEHRFRGIRRCC